MPVLVAVSMAPPLPPMPSPLTPSPSAAERARPLASHAVAVVVIACLLNFTGRGVSDALAAFILPLEAEFGWARSDLTGVFATVMLVSGLAAPLAGFIFDRFGPRLIYGVGLLLLGAAAVVAAHAQTRWQIYLGAGVMMGAGAAATGMVCATTLIARWHRARLTTAIAIAYAGAGSGTLVLLPVAQALIDSVGWRGAWLVLGGLPLVAAPVCLVLPWTRLSHPPEIAAAPAAAKRVPDAVGAASTAATAAHSDSAAAAPATASHPLSNAQPTSRMAALRAAWSDPCYWQLAQIFFFTALASYHVTPQVVAMLIEGGMKPIVAASAYGFAGLLSTVGIIGAGWLGDRLGHQRAGLTSFVLTASGLVGLLWVALSGSPVGLLMYVFGFGLAQGARGPIVSMLSNRLYAGPAAGMIYGTIYALMAIGAAIGAWSGGLLHDLTASYWPLVAVALAWIGLAALPFRTTSALMKRSRALVRAR